MSDLVLRPYQAESINKLREGVRAGHKRQILCSPTGSGKTEMAIAVIQEALEKRTKTAFIVDRLSILYQTEGRFDQHSIPFGVLQAGHYRFRPWENLQLCSSQTLARRGIGSDFRLLVVDEAHTAYKSTVQFIEAHPDIVTLGLTATPFAKGLGKIYTNVVNITTTDKLIEEGYLSPLKVYAAKRIDMTGARLKFDGEWNEEDIEKRGIAIIGDVVEGWVQKTVQYFGGPAKTIVFSATVAHGEELCRQFQAAGYNFQQVSYKDGNDDSRRALIEEFRKPDSDIVGLISCEALAKGFDVPDIRVGVSCRPYRKSLSGHIQSLGRVMRPAPGKDFALWLDHSGNYLRFADDMQSFFANGVSDLSNKELDSKVRKDPEEKEANFVCGQCKFLMMPKDLNCPACGWVRPRRVNTIDHEPGELVGVDLKKSTKDEWLKDKETIWRQIVGYAIEAKGGDMARAEKWALAQYRNLYETWPRHAMRNVAPMEPSAQLSRKLKSLAIAYFKGKARREERPHA